MRYVIALVGGSIATCCQEEREANNKETLCCIGENCYHYNLHQSRSVTWLGITFLLFLLGLWPWSNMLSPMTARRVDTPTGDPRPRTEMRAAPRCRAPWNINPGQVSIEFISHDQNEISESAWVAISDSDIPGTVSDIYSSSQHVTIGWITVLQCRVRYSSSAITTPRWGKNESSCHARDACLIESQERHGFSFPHWSGEPSTEPINTSAIQLSRLG